MDIRHLKYLSAVVNYGDYRLAARSLFISPQGLSKAIRQLENELGLALMEKVGRESRPTNAAIELIARSSQLISEYDLLLGFLCTDKKREVLRDLEKLTLGVYNAGLRGDIFSNTDFSLLFDRLQPIRFELIRRPSAVCLGGVLNGILDAAVILGKPNADELSYHRIASIPVHVSMVVNHPLGAKSGIALSDLNDWPIAYPDDLRYIPNYMKREFDRKSLNLTFEEVPPKSEEVDAFLEKGGLFLTSPYGFIGNKTIERPLESDGEIAFDMYMIYRKGEVYSIYSDILFFFRNELNKILLTIRNR